MRSPAALMPHLNVNRHAFIHGVGAVRDRLNHRVDIRFFTFSKEADVPQVHAQQRNITATRQLGRAQHRTVAAQNHDELKFSEPHAFAQNFKV